MSSIVVSVAVIEELTPHVNSDNLELAKILGWQIVVRKQEYKVGDKIVYAPPDSVLPSELAERLNVVNYLSKGRVRAIRLRGEPSFGLTIPPDEDWPVGENVAEYYGILKYEPPVRMTGNDGEPEHPLFIRYTDIENLRTFPDVLVPGEPLVISEKIDGTNCRVGLIDGQVICGSMRVQRRKPTDEDRKLSLYWYAYTHVSGVKELLHALGNIYRQVILFGEVYGPGVNSFTYGVAQGKVEFRLFDIFCDGRYLDWESASDMCKQYGVTTAPILATLPYDLNAIKQLSAGNTTIGGASHIREGVVVRPVHERTHPKTGRVILKYVSDEYLVKKSAGKVADFSEV